MPLVREDVLPTHVRPPTLAETGEAQIREALTGAGLWIDVGAVTARLRSDSPDLPRQIGRVYGAFPLAKGPAWADVHIDIRRASGWRRLWRPQVVLHCDGDDPFEPFHGNHALPLFEWGCNWMIAQRLHHLLMLHAGVLERDGLTLLMPAVPGSGKSTLTAALAHRGWRLLSDEFGAFDPVRREFRPMLKPIALKNRSIDVIQAFAPQAVLGPAFPNTRKGTVAHVAPNADAVARRQVAARPGAVVFPRWQAGVATRLEPIAADVLFTSLSYNAFNYAVMGEAGFDAVAGLAAVTPAWQLTYSDLEDAVALLDRTWLDVLQIHADRPLTA